MAREHDERMSEAALDRGMDPGMGGPAMDRHADRPAMGTADLVAAAEGRPSARAMERDPAMARDVEDAREVRPAGAAGAAGTAQAAQQVETRRAPEAPGSATPGGAALAALFEAGAAQAFRERWREVQVGFVDDPRQAVAHADELVAQVMKSLAESFARQRSRIEAEVGQGEAQASTENLRVALTRYRSFFERLLSL